MKISVLMSVYYKEKPEYLDKAIKSIIEQMVIPDEIVLIKDGPLTAKLDDVINKYKNDYPSLFKIVSLKKNMGLGLALREGLKYCSHDIIARMDSDDICYTDRFEKQLKFLSENPDVAIIGSYINEFNESPGDINSIRQMPLDSNELISFSRKRNPLNHPTVMFKKKIIEDSGSYVDMPLFEDYYLWLRVIKKGYKIANISEPLLYFRTEDMVGRRHGWNYMKKEYHFYRTCCKEHLLNKKSVCIVCSLRLPVRLMPKRILLILYKKYLRKRKTS
jgi:glycosyltransferase involved in cell wall biosynthesis